MPRRPQRFPAMAGSLGLMEGSRICAQMLRGEKNSPGGGRIGLWASDTREGCLQGEYGVIEGAH